MREITVLSAVLLFVVGCGCGDDAEDIISDAGTVDSQASIDSGVIDRDVGTTSDGGMDATNDRRIDTGLDAAFQQPPPTLQDLNGTWFGPCYEYNGENLSLTLVFSGDTMNSQIGFYDNASCQIRWLFIDIEMSVSIPEPAESSQARGVYRLVFEVKSVTGTVTIEEAVEAVNEIELFGYSDWKVDEPKEIDGRGFIPSDTDAGADGDQLPEIGQQGEFLFRLNIAGDQLQIRDLDVGSLPNDIYSKQ